jgi:hypothetical protein
MWLSERWLLPVAWAGLLAAAALGWWGEDETAARSLAVASALVAVLDLVLWVYDEMQEHGLVLPEHHRLPVPAWGPFAVVTSLLSLLAAAVVGGTAGGVLAAVAAVGLLAGGVDTVFAFLGDREPFAPARDAPAPTPRPRRRRKGVIAEPVLVPRHRVRRARAIRRAVGEDAGHVTGELLPVGRGRSRIVVHTPDGFSDVVVGGALDPEEASRVAELAGMRLS